MEMRKTPPLSFATHASREQAVTVRGPPTEPATASSDPPSTLAPTRIKSEQDMHWVSQPPAGGPPARCRL